MVSSPGRRASGPRRGRSALLVAAVSVAALFGAAGTASASTATDDAAAATDSLCLISATEVAMIAG